MNTTASILNHAMQNSLNHNSSYSFFIRTILHDTVLSHITGQYKTVLIPPNDKDRIYHYGANSFKQYSRFKSANNNQAIALKVIHSKIGFDLFTRFINNTDNEVLNDALHIAINELKHKFCSDFYTLFSLPEISQGFNHE